MFTHSEGKGLQALGLRPGEVVGRYVWELYADNPEVLGSVRRALAGENHTETLHVGEIAFETRYAPYRDASGGVLGVIGVATDVTEQRRADQALRISESRYRTLFERNLAGVFRSTLEGRILDCNESFARMFGYESPEEVRLTTELGVAGVLCFAERMPRIVTASPSWKLDRIALADNSPARRTILVPFDNILSVQNNRRVTRQAD